MLGSIELLMLISIKILIAERLPALVVLPALRKIFLIPSIPSRTKKFQKTYAFPGCKQDEFITSETVFARTEQNEKALKCTCYSHFGWSEQKPIHIKVRIPLCN
jgi:hypothetical protein